MTAVPAQRSDHGFSLIELAVVLVVLGLIIGGGIVALEVGTERQRRAQAERELEEIRTALYGYAMSSGRLPCPDVPSSLNGEEDDNGSDDNCEQGGEPAGSSWRIGGLPWRDLGLGRRDPWGDRYLYAVVDDYAGDPVDQSDPGKPVDENLGSSFPLRVELENGISVDEISSSVPALIISFGGQGRRIWSQWRDAGTPCPGLDGFSDDESENCDGDSTFVAADYRGADAGAGRFDDLVIWLPDAILKARMVEAGRLP